MGWFQKGQARKPPVGKSEGCLKKGVPQVILSQTNCIGGCRDSFSSPKPQGEALPTKSQSLQNTRQKLTYFVSVTPSLKTYMQGTLSSHLSSTGPPPSSMFSPENTQRLSRVNKQSNKHTTSASAKDKTVCMKFFIDQNAAYSIRKTKSIQTQIHLSVFAFPSLTFHQDIFNEYESIYTLHPIGYLVMWSYIRFCIPMIQTYQTGKHSQSCMQL